MKKNLLSLGAILLMALFSTGASAAELTPSDATIMLSQGSDYTFADAEGYYVNPSFFTKNSDGTYTFKALTGTYRVQANESLKYLEVTVMRNGEPATLQTNGTGALWIIGGDKIGLPTAAANAVNWGTERAICMAPVSTGVYEITLVVGKELTGDNFKFFHQNNWGDEYVGKANDEKPYTLISTSDLFKVGDGTGGNNNDNGNIYVKDGATLDMGSTITLTVDCSAGIAEAVLSTTVKASEETFEPTFDGTAMTNESGVYTFKGNLVQGQTYVASGAEAMNADDWYVNADYFERQADGSLKFLAIDGRYEVKADFSKNYFNVFPIDDSDEPATLQDDFTGAVWAIGYAGKPTHHNDDSQSWWTDVDHALALAPIAEKVYQLTLTVGQEVKADYVDFKFFGQAGWGTEFSDTDKKISINDNGVFKLDGGNIKIADEATLNDGETYVFTLDCTDSSEAVLTVTGGQIASGIGTIAAQAAKALDAIYTLQGQRVASATQRGIYIVNGKKVIK